MSFAALNFLGEGDILVVSQSLILSLRNWRNGCRAEDEHENAAAVIGKQWTRHQR
jgi:hypothetical protein